MKAKSNKSPSTAVFEKVNGTLRVRLCENIVECERLGETIYEYDEYVFVLKDREGLREDIESNLERWLATAEARERKNLANTVRLRRNELLAASDWTQFADSPLDEEEKASWRAYRQYLRDITKDESFPYVVL